MADSKIAKKLKNAEIALRREQQKKRPDPLAIAKAAKVLEEVQGEKRIARFSNRGF